RTPTMDATVSNSCPPLYERVYEIGRPSPKSGCRPPYPEHMTAAQLISFARGAPSLDIVDVAGLKAAAARAFDADPVAATGYGPGAGYLPLREWIGVRHGVGADQ